jgi:energy-coupling factor transporter transmembrane protein EcfT
MSILAVIFTIILLALGALVVYILFFAVWVPSIFLFRIKRKWRATFIAIPLVGFVYVAALVGLWMYSTSSSVVYKNTFGTPPAADILNINSKLYYFADYGEVYLQFECNRDTLDSLIASKNMDVDSAPKAIWSDPPKWWNPGPVASWPECYRSDQSIKGFASEEAILIYDLKTKQANYYWSGID